MIDALSFDSRLFYERTKSKLTASLLLSGVALMLLGFSSYAGGLASSSNTYYNKLKKTSNDDYLKTSQSQLVTGYGFATFFYLVGFIILIAAAIYVSPLLCGSPNEQKSIRSPQEVDDKYSKYNDESQA